MEGLVEKVFLMEKVEYYWCLICLMWIYQHVEG
jgi:hypothetical protein